MEQKFAKPKKMRIVYCKPCGYLPEAEKIKAEVERVGKGNVQVMLEAGDKGIFDVYVEGKLVFSKAKTMRFPVMTEIWQALK